jgi:hypothetical protein
VKNKEEVETPLTPTLSPLRGEREEDDVETKASRY